MINNYLIEVDTYYSFYLNNILIERSKLTKYKTKI